MAVTNSFTGILQNKFVIKRLLIIPPHLSSVSTLPYEIGLFCLKIATFKSSIKRATVTRVSRSSKILIQFQWVYHHFIHQLKDICSYQWSHRMKWLILCTCSNLEQRRRESRQKAYACRPYTNKVIRSGSVGDLAISKSWSLQQ